MNSPTRSNLTQDDETAAALPVRPPRPGWPEIGVAAVAFGALFLLTSVILHAIPADQAVAEGLVGYAMSALVALGAFAAAVCLRIRRTADFGVRRVSGKWLLIGAGFGVVAFVLSIVASGPYTTLTGDGRNIQTGYQAAAHGGVLVLVATLLLGSVATPIGEELAFRGVLTNALGRYGAWVAVLGSDLVFALAHGVNQVLPVAFVNGVVAALLFRRTGSVWPGVMVHLVNNTFATLSSVVLPLLLAATPPA